MEITKATIEGSNIKRLAEILDKNNPNSYKYSSDDIFILANEKLYLLAGLKSLSIVVVKYMDKNKCTIEIVTGGGPVGFNWGSHRNRNERIVEALTNICSSNSWKLTTKQNQ